MKTILIVEDEVNIQKLLQECFKHTGYQIETAIDGKEAVDKITRIRPSLILLDLRLPKLSGEEVCKFVKDGEDRELAQTPIIMMTGKTSEADHIVGRMLGAKLYLTKPFDIHKVVNQVAKCLMERELQVA